VQDAPDWLRLERNLPRLVGGAAGCPPRAAIERCPTGAIVWYSHGKPVAASARIGRATTRIERQTA
jgi:hypothetical protein